MKWIVGFLIIVGVWAIYQENHKPICPYCHKKLDYNITYDGRHPECEARYFAENHIQDVLNPTGRTTLVKGREVWGVLFVYFFPVAIGIATLCVTTVLFIKGWL